MKERTLRCHICKRNRACADSGGSHCRSCWVNWVSVCNRSKDAWHMHQKQQAAKAVYGEGQG